MKKQKPTPEPFHRRLAAARHRAGLLQRDVAAAAGMSVQQLSHYETGHNEPGVSVLRRLCVALGCSADELLGLSPTEKP